MLSLAGCGSDAPPPPRTSARASFEANSYGERVFEAYRQTGVTTQVVILPAGSRAVGITLDCAGAQGQLEVTLSTAGGASIDCSPTGKGRPGFVSLSGDGSLLKRKQKMAITGPNSQQWSVAVDAGARVTSGDV